jgi:hypothetical protein
MSLICDIGRERVKKKSATQSRTLLVRTTQKFYFEVNLGITLRNIIRSICLFSDKLLATSVILALARQKRIIGRL